MINIFAYQIDAIRKSSVIKKIYELRNDDKSIELVIDEVNLKHEIAFKIYEGNLVKEIKRFWLSDDVEYSDGLMLRYLNNFDSDTVGRLHESTSYEYDKNGNMVLMYITRYATTGNSTAEDHLYQYDYKNRVIREAITKYVVKKKSEFEIEPIQIKEMIRIDSYYDNKGNRFDTHIKIQEDGYFIYEVLKEVYISAVQLYPHFHIHHVKKHNHVHSINIPLIFESNVKTKYPVYNKTNFDFIFDVHKNLIAEREQYPFIKAGHQLLKIDMTTYYNIEYTFKESNGGNFMLILKGE